MLFSTTCCANFPAATAVAYLKSKTVVSASLAGYVGAENPLYTVFRLSRTLSEIASRNPFSIDL
jgi:hypothetical protein